MADKPFNNFAQVAQQLHAATKEGVIEVALKVDRKAKMKAAVDSGRMRSSVHVVTIDGSPDNSSLSGPDIIPDPQVPDDHTAFVVASVDYAVFVEKGTVHMAARPFLLPAAEEVRQEMANDLKKSIGAALK